MEIYFDKIDKVLRKKRMSQTELCNKLGVVRTTYWNWKNGNRRPNERTIRRIAEIVNISVDHISSLMPAKAISSENISQFEESWLTLFKTDIHTHKAHSDKLLEMLKSQQNQLWQSGVIIKSLLSSLNVMFYVKNTNLKYIIANEAFLENVSLAPEFHVLNCEDKIFFSLKETLENSDEDQKVVMTGESVLNVEKYIPGSKKKKWGIVSKVPIFDSKGGIAGLVGTFIDITERKTLELERKKNNEYLEQTVAERTVELENSNSKLKVEISSRKSTEKDLIRNTKALTERVKELNCLYELSKTIRIPNISLKEICQTAVSLIPSSWQYPEITCARIIIDKDEYVTDNFEESKWRLSYPLTIEKNTIGIIEVYYLEDRVNTYNNSPFLEEELNLIRAISEYLTRAKVRITNTLALCERVKELNCLYELSEIIGTPDLSWDEICQRAVNLIPPSWQYPDITCARMIIYEVDHRNEREFVTSNYKKSAWKMNSVLKIGSEMVGILEVYYLEPKPLLYNRTPFLHEEFKLLRAVADDLSRAMIQFRNTHALQERVKEINCLYQLSEIIGIPNISFNEICQRAVNLFPPSWQYPEVTCSRMIVNGKIFKTGNFAESKWKISSNLKAGNNVIGRVDVFYLESKPIIFNNSPFLNEEIKLLRAVADYISRVAARMNNMHALTERVKELNCLYELSGIIGIPDISFGEICKRAVNLIPASWQYPEITCARMIVNNMEYTTDNFSMSQWKMDSTLKKKREIVGVIEVYYLETKPVMYDNSPFLFEEIKLLRAISDYISRYMERNS